MKYIAFKFSTKSDKVERYFQENYPEFEQMWVNEFLQSNISHTYYFIIKRQIAGEKLLKTISYELSNICGGFYSYWGYKIYDCPPHEYHEKRLTDYLGQHAHYSEETLGIKRCLYEFGTLEEGSFKKYLLGILKEFNLGNLDEELVNNVLGILRQKRIFLDLNDLNVIEKIFISYQYFPDSQIRLNALKLIGNFKKQFLKLWDWIRDYELDKRIIIYAIKKRSNKKKKAAVKFKLFRKRNNIRVCRRCEKRLTDETHHFLCNSCHKEKRREKRSARREYLYQKYGTIDLR